MGAQDVQVRILLSVNGMQSLQQLNGAVRGQYKSMGDVQKQMVSGGRLQLQNIRSMDDLSKALKGVQTDYDAVYRAAYRVMQAGTMMQGVGMAGIKSLKSAVTAWGDYEFSLQRAANSLDMTKDQMQALSVAVQDAAIETRFFTPAEIAHDVYLWGSATGQTIKTQEDLNRVMGQTVSILKLAAMTQTDYESTAKGVYAVITQYGMALSDVNKVSAAFYQISRKTALEVPDLVESFKMVGPMAHALGVSFEEVAGTLGILGDLGQRGSMAGRGLGMFLTQMVRPAPKGIQAMNDLFAATMHVQDGYNKLVFPKGKFIGIEKFVTLLAKATNGLTDQQKLNYITTIVGTQNAARQIIPLINAQTAAVKAGTSMWADAKYTTEGAEKAFSDAWGNMSSTWKGIVGLVKNSLMPIMLMAGQSVAKFATPAMEALSGVAVKFTLFLRLNPKIADFAVKVLAIASSVLALTGSVMVAAGGMLLFKTVLTEAGVGLISLIAPFLILEAVVAGVAYVFYKNVGGISDAFKHLGRVLGPIIKEAIDNIVNFVKWLGNLGRGAKGAPTSAFKVIADVINKIADAIAMVNKNREGHKVLVGIVDALLIYSGLSAGIWATTVAFGAFLALGKAMKAASLAMNILSASTYLFSSALWSTGIPEIILAIVAVVALLYLAWTNNWGDIQGKTKFVMDWLAQNIPPVIDTIAKVIGDFVKGASDFFAWLVPQLQNAWKLISDAFTTAVGIIQSVATAIVDFGAKVLGVLQAVAKPFDDFGRMVIGVIQTVLGYVVSLGQTFVDVFVNKMLPAIGWVASSIGNFVTTVAEALGPLIGAIVDLVGALIARVQDIIKFFQPVIDFIMSILVPVLQALADIISNVLIAGFNNLIAIVSAVKDIFLAVVDAILKAVTPFLQMLMQLFGDAFQVIAGIVSYVIDTITNIVKTFIDVITGIIRVFTDILKGDWGKAWQDILGIVESIWNGIKKQIENALTLIGRVVGAGLDAVKTVVFGVFETIKGIISGAWEIVQTGLRVGIDAVKTMFEGIGTVVGSVFGGIKGIIAGAINAVLGVINAAIDGINGIQVHIEVGPVKYDFNGLHLGHIPLVKLHRGGIVPGPLGQEVPTVLQAGELVIPSSKVTEMFNKLNVSSDNTRTIKLQVEVTSPDGSVTRLDASQIAGLLNSGALVQSLERMAAVA
jgi:TP901 family phage tail tape measure protein